MPVRGTSRRSRARARSCGTKDGRSALRLSFPGATPGGAPFGVAPLASRSNYFIGSNPGDWKKDVPHFARVEWGAIETGRYGIGYTFFSSQETETHPRDTKTNGDWNLVSFYGGWRTGEFFVTPQINLGQGDFHSRRSIVAGTIARSATANWSNYLAAGGFTTGYIMNIAGFQVIPEISLDGLYMRGSAYNENGGGGIGLSLKQQNQKSVTSIFFSGALTADRVTQRSLLRASFTPRRNRRSSIRVTYFASQAAFSTSLRRACFSAGNFSPSLVT